MIRRAPALATLLVLLAALVWPSASAFAQYEDIPQRFERSLYLQLNGLLALPQFSDGDGVTIPDTTGSTSGGLGVRVGLRSSGWGAIEAQFEWVHGMDPNGNTSGDDWTTTFNARIYPINSLIGKIDPKGIFQPYLLVGAGATSYKLNDPNVGNPTDPCLGNACPDRRRFGFSSRWGGGLDVYVTEKIAVTAECTYVWVVGDHVKDLSYLSLGLGAIYRFY